MDIFSKTSYFPKKHHRCISLESGQTLTKKSYPKTPLDLPRFYPRRYSTPELAMRKHALKYQRDDSCNEQPISNKSCQTDILGLDKYLQRSPPGDASLNSAGHSAVLRTYKKPTKKPKVRSVGVHCERRRMTFAAFKGCQKFKHVYKRKISLPQPPSTATSTDDGRRDSGVLPKLRPDRTDIERPAAAKAIPVVKLPRISTRDVKPEPNRTDDCVGGGTKLAKLTRPQSTGSSGGGGSSSGADRKLAYFRASSAPKIDSRYYTLITAPQPPSDREQPSTAGSSDTADTTLDMSFVRRQSGEENATAAATASTTAGTSSTTRTVSTSTTFTEPVFPIVFSCESVLRHPLDGGYVSHTESHRFSVHYVPVEDVKAVTTDDTDDGSRSSLVFTSAGACQNERCLTGDSICVTLGGAGGGASKPADDSVAVSRYEPCASSAVGGERRLYVERSNADVLQFKTADGTSADGDRTIVGQRPPADHYRSSVADGCCPVDKTTGITTVTAGDDQRPTYGSREYGGPVKTVGFHVLGKGDGIDVSAYEEATTIPSMSANKTIDDFGKDNGGAGDGGTVLEPHHAHTDDMPFQSDERNYERLTQNNQIVNSGGTVSNQSPKFDGTATRLGTIERNNDLAGPAENDDTHANELNAPRANVELTERSTTAADAVPAAKDWYDDEPTQRIRTDDNNRLTDDDSLYLPNDNATAMSPPHGRKLHRCDSTAKHSTIMDRKSSCDNTNRLIARSTNQHNGSVECRYSEHSSSSHRRNVPVRLNDHMSRKRNDDSGNGDSKECRIELQTDRNSHPKQHTDQHRHPQQHADRHPHPQQHADRHPLPQQHTEQHSHTQQHADKHPHSKQYTDQHPHPKQHADGHPHPKQHVDRHPHSQQHADGNTHLQQNVDRHPHSQQHVDGHTHPQQHADRHPHSQQHADGNTHLQQHVDRHPHSQQHGDGQMHPQKQDHGQPHPHQNTDEHTHPQKHADGQPQPHQHADGRTHPQKHADRHTHSHQHIDGHPHPKQHADGHTHPQKHADQHPQPHRYTDGHTHTHQHIDEHAHPKQHTDGHTHPHQHANRHPHLQQHADGHTHPQKHNDQHPQPHRHIDGHTHTHQHIDEHAHPKQHTDGHTHPHQHADRHSHPQQHIDRLPIPKQHTDGHSYLQQHAHEHAHPKQHVDGHSHPEQHVNRHSQLYPQQHADRHSHQQQHVDHNPHSHKTVAAPHSNVVGHSHHHEVANAQSHRHGTANDQHHRSGLFSNRADETGGKRPLQRSKSTLHVRAGDEDTDSCRRYSIHGGVLSHGKHETRTGAESHHGYHNPKSNKSAESGGYSHNHQRHHHGESTQRSVGNDKKQHSTYKRKPLESVDETMETKESNYVGGCLFGDAYYKKQPQKYDTDRYNDSKKVNFSSKPNFEYYHDYVPGTIHSPRDEDCTVFAETPPYSDDSKNNGQAPNDHHGYSTTETAAAQASYYSQLDRSYGDDKNTDSDESLTDSLEEGCKYEGAAVSYFLSLNGQKSAVTFTLKMPNTLESRLNRRHSQLKKHLHVSTTVRKTSIRVRTRHKSCQTLWTEEKGVQVHRGSTANANRKLADDHKVLETLLAGMTRHHVSENQIRVVGGRKLVSEGNQTERMPEPPTDRQTQTTRDAAAGPETPDNSTTGGRNNRGQSMKKFSSDNALMVGVVRQNKYKGKEAVDGAKNDQLLTLSKGWINFYTLKADSADCTDAQELHDNDDEVKTEDDSQQYTVHVQAIPEPVSLPVVVHVPNRNNLQLTKTCSTVKHLPKLVQTENNNHHCAPPLATATTNGWCVSVDGPNNMHMKVSLLPDKLENKTSENFDHNEENKLESRRLALQRKNNYMRKPYRSIKRTQSTPRDMFSADVSRTESALSAESKYIETIDTQLLIHKARRRLSQEWDTRIQNGGVTESVQLVVTGDSVSSKTSQHYANRGHQHCSFRRQSRRI